MDAMTTLQAKQNPLSRDSHRHNYHDSSCEGSFPCDWIEAREPTNLSRRMAGAPGSDAVMVVVCFPLRPPCSMNCEGCMTMAQVRDAWHEEIGATPPVAFFMPQSDASNRRLPDSLTVSQALLESTCPQVLVVNASPRIAVWLQVFGFEETLVPFEVAPSSTPAEVRQGIGREVGIATDNYLLSWDGAALDADQSFEDQGLTSGTTLTVDLQLTINVVEAEGTGRRSISCLSSKTVGELRQELDFEDNMMLVSTSPYRHVLCDSLRLCHIVSDLMDLHVPIELVAERKVLLSFQPITLPHRRQQVPVALSSTPLDIHEMLSDCFELDTEYRLTVDGQALNSYQPLIEQLLDTDTVIDLDIARECGITDLWADLHHRCDDLVYLYSTEGSHGLFLRDFTGDQRIFYDGTLLTLFGSMLDIFGAISGQRRARLLVDRDLERNVQVMSFDHITQKLTWARNLLLDIAPISRGLYERSYLKEIMCYGELAAARMSLKQLCLSEDSLIVLNPQKVVVSSDKKLRLLRLARGSTHGDVLARMRQLKNSRDFGLKARGRPIADQEINAQLDLEHYLLCSESWFRTKVTVSLKNQWYGCWFKADSVCFSDIMIHVGKQAEVSPRHLFSGRLFCSGCGRKITKEEEKYQTVPSDCCRVRSLDLTDCPVKEVGIQTATPRSRDKATYTLYPEERDACVGPDWGPVSERRRAVTQASPPLRNACVGPDWGPVSERRRALTQASPPVRSAASAHPPPLPTKLCVSARTPDGLEQQKIVTVIGRTCRALLSAAAHELAFLLGDAAVASFQEFVYERGSEKRLAWQCYSEDLGRIGYFDAEDGAPVEFWLRSSLRLLRPSSPLPFARRRQPFVFIQTDTDLLTTNERGHIQAAPADALTDRAFVALTRGVRTDARFFWENQAGKFFDAASGAEFDQEDVPGRSGKRHFLLLMRNGRPVPRIAIERFKDLLFLKRDGLDLQMDKGCVRCAGTLQTTDIERWDFLWRGEALYKNFRP